MTTNLPNGIGASSGDTLVTTSGLLMSGTPYFVSSVIGSDANSGLSRQDPMATIGAAYAACTTDDWIVLAADHDETLTSTLTVSKAIHIIGEGSSSGQPTAKLSNNQAAAVGLDINIAHVNIRNVKFGAQVQSCSGAVVYCDNTHLILTGCRFELDGNSDASVGLQLVSGANDCELHSCYFVSTSARQTLAVNNDPPYGAMEITAAVSDIVIRGTTFDGGEIGFGTTAFDTSSGVITRLRADGMSFLNGADYSIASTTTGFMQIGTVTGDVVGSW